MTDRIYTMAEMNDKIEASYRRKKPAKSFLAKYPSTCTRCHDKIQVGDRCHYVDGQIVHHTHPSS